jgi:hypothetical protein
MMHSHHVTSRYKGKFEHEKEGNKNNMQGTTEKIGKENKEMMEGHNCKHFRFVIFTFHPKTAASSGSK